MAQDLEDVRIPGDENDIAKTHHRARISKFTEQCKWLRVQPFHDQRELRSGWCFIQLIKQWRSLFLGLARFVIFRRRMCDRTQCGCSGRYLN
ncbi:MAG: hypothetical protein WD851_11170 [Pirellulales bacterium]